MNDFDIDNHGSIVIFTPRTHDAAEFAETAFSSAMGWGCGYAVGHRYAEDIMFDLVMNEGFACSLDGQPIVGMQAAQ